MENERRGGGGKGGGGGEEEEEEEEVLQIPVHLVAKKMSKQNGQATSNIG